MIVRNLTREVTVSSVGAKFVVLLMLLAMSHLVQGQVLESRFIKVLPGPKPGIIKVMYAIPTNKPLYVQFYQEGKLIKKDLIRGYNFKKGFIKSYDVSNLRPGNYEVRISSAGLGARYAVSPSTDGHILSASLIGSSIMDLMKHDQVIRDKNNWNQGVGVY